MAASTSVINTGTEQRLCFLIMRNPKTRSAGMIHLLRFTTLRNEQEPIVILTSMLEQTLEEGRKLADAALERLLPPGSERPTSIHRAMRHSVVAGGKSNRQTLCTEAEPGGVAALTAAS